MRHRASRILKFWDRSEELSIKNKSYREFVSKFFNLQLSSDLKTVDLTTDSLIKNKKITAVIVAKEDGILAGLEEFSLINKDLKLNILKKDGGKIKNGEVILKIEGNAKKILERERASLNLLQRMSGIATLTHRLDKKLLGKVKIVATRKTLWGYIDKKSVSVGNGLTHRLSLSDGIIIKDNHLKMLKYNFEKALKLSVNKSRYVEIEVEDKNQAGKSANAIKNLIKRKGNTIFAVMLDKIPPDEIKPIIDNFRNKGLYNDVLFEASGNISEDNLTDYAGCGADIVSMGSITNSAKTLDMSLEIK